MEKNIPDRDNNLENDIDNDMDNELWYRREYRRKRRKRNQLIVFVATGLVLIGIAAGAIFGVRYLAGIIKARSLAKAAEEEAMMEAETLPEEEMPVVETPEEYIEPEAEEKSALDSVVDTCIAELPLEDKVAGLFFVTPEELTGTGQVIQAGETTKEKLREFAVGGLIYFSDNIQSEEQLIEMLGNTKSMSKYPIFLGVDEEGGRVSRVAEKSLGEPVSPMGEIGKGGQAEQAFTAGQTIGSYLAELGFNMDFAPVADVLGSEDNQILGDRSFGTDSAAAGSMVAEVVRGLQEAGIKSCLKHFPGLGWEESDTHEGTVISERTLEELQASDFIAFKAGIDAGAEFVMVSHLALPEVIGDNTPSSLSSRMITDILRGELGYDGIVITDALNMEAISAYYTSGEACVEALKAGADMLLMPESFEEGYAAVLAAVQDGTLSEERLDESLRRIYRVKYRDQVTE